MGISWLNGCWLLLVCHQPGGLGIELQDLLDNRENDRNVGLVRIHIE
jgi:hypothetical protein